MELPYPPLSRAFVGLHGVNPLINHNSSPRGAMLAAHLGQALVIEGVEPPLVESGVLQEIGNYTYSIIAPEDLIVRGIIPTFPDDMSRELGITSKRRLLVYEGLESSTLGVIWLEEFHTLDQGFGFEYKYNQDYLYLTAGDAITRGSVLADTPSKDNDGLYGIGINMRAVALTHPGTTEDGVVLSEEVIKRMGFYVEEKSSYDLNVINRKRGDGHMALPLNLYGTIEHPKLFPDIGERTNKDNIVFAVRDIMPESILQITPENLREVDYNFDEYFKAWPGSKVTDIEIYRGTVLDTSDNPLFKQLNMYADAKLEFNKILLRTVASVMHNARTSGTNLHYTPEAAALVRKTMMTTPQSMGGALTSTRSSLRIRPVKKQSPIGDYSINFTVRHRLVPNYGFKITDLNGGKGVICSILPKEQMPDGVDIIIDPNSTVGRTNLGRIIEMGLTSSLERMNNGVKSILGIPHDAEVTSIPKVGKETVKKAIDYIIGFYNIVNEGQAEYIRSLGYREQLSVIEDIVVKGGIIHYPINRKKPDTEVLEELIKSKDYKPYKKRVSWKNKHGETVSPKARVLVGKLMIMLLNKICTDGIASASPALNHYGIPAKTSGGVRNWRPLKSTPVRAVGETEGRIIAGYLEPKAVAEIMDRAASIETHTALYANILKADNPAGQTSLVDREVLPYGNTRPLAMLDHLMLLRGRQLKMGDDS